MKQSLSSEDARLQRSARGGDLEAFGLLVKKHQAAVRTFVAARINDPVEAQDLAQDVFVTAYEKFEEFDPDQPLRPWLFAIATNLVRNHLRKHKALPLSGESNGLLDLINSEIEALDVHWRDTPVYDALEKCLSRLGTEERNLVKLRYEDGLEVKELLRMLGGNHSALTMKLHRIRGRLRDCIENHIGENAHAE